MILKALFTIFSMYYSNNIFDVLFQRPLLLYVSPKYLWSDIKETGIPSNSIFGRCSCNFRVNKRVSIFRGLKFINRCFAQADKIFRSWLSMPLRSRIEGAEQNNKLSSAKSLVKLKRDSAMST